MLDDHEKKLEQEEVSSVCLMITKRNVAQEKKWLAQLRFEVAQVVDGPRDEHKVTC